MNGDQLLSDGKYVGIHRNEVPISPTFCGTGYLDEGKRKSLEI
jgi:hypothetical protein